MFNAEQFYYSVIAATDSRDERVEAINKRDLENRIAGLREAAGLAILSSGPADMLINNRITELEKELNK